MIRLAECTYLEAGRLARDERSVILLPLGAVEQHGPHLPLMVDWLGAEELAQRIAPHLRRAGYRVILAPALPYGASPLAERWPGTVSLSRATLVRVIVEVIRGLARPGFRRFVLTNYQADRRHLRAMAEAKRTAPRVRRRWRSCSRASARTRGPRRHGEPRVLRWSEARAGREWHSGELETALMLARRPELVRAAGPAAAAGLGGLPRRARRGVRRFEDIAPGGAGYFGWPAAARAVTAERALRLRGRLMAREIIRAFADRKPPRPPRGRARRPVRATA